MFFCMQHATTCHQQSVRSNESLLRPATRRSGITSLRRSGRISRCGRNNPRYVCNALSHAGSVYPLYTSSLSCVNFKAISESSLSHYALLRVCTISPNTLVLQIVFRKVPQVSEERAELPVIKKKEREKEIGQTHASLRALQFDTFIVEYVTIWQINPVGNTHNIKNNIWNRR